MEGESLNIVSALKLLGKNLTIPLHPKILKELFRILVLEHACGGMYTANTMSSAIEALGMSLPYSSSNPALSPEKKMLRCRRGYQNFIRKDIKPRDHDA
jgi:dihydroxy-acid dehydratase